MLRVLESLEQKTGKLGLVLASIALVSMVVIIFVEVIARYIFNHPLGVADEFSAYLLVWLTFLGLVYNASIDAHIKVRIVVSKLSRRVQGRLRVPVYLLFLLFAAVFTKIGYDFVLYNYVRGTKSFQLWLTPQWIPMLAIPIGCGVLLLLLLLRIIRSIKEMQGDRR